MWWCEGVKGSFLGVAAEVHQHSLDPEEYILKKYDMCVDCLSFLPSGNLQYILAGSNYSWLSLITWKKQRTNNSLTASQYSQTRKLTTLYFLNKIGFFWIW